MHAATKAARLAFREMYALFVAAYREAAEKLRKGDLSGRVAPIGVLLELPDLRTSLDVRALK